MHMFYHCYGFSGSPKVNLREIITQKHEFTFTHKRQHGGRGEWARISGYFEPIDRERRTLVSRQSSTFTDY